MECEGIKEKLEGDTHANADSVNDRDKNMQNYVDVLSDCFFPLFLSHWPSFQ